MLLVLVADEGDAVGVLDLFAETLAGHVTLDLALVLDDADQNLEDLNSAEQSDRLQDIVV